MIWGSEYMYWDSLMVIADIVRNGYISMFRRDWWLGKNPKGHRRGQSLETVNHLRLTAPMTTSLQDMAPNLKRFYK